MPNSSLPIKHNCPSQLSIIARVLLIPFDGANFEYNFQYNSLCYERQINLFHLHSFSTHTASPLHCSALRIIALLQKSSKSGKRNNKHTIGWMTLDEMSSSVPEILIAEKKGKSKAQQPSIGRILSSMLGSLFETHLDISEHEGYLTF